MTTHTDPAYLLGDLLKNVSRSFYLTLRVLPDGMREPVGLAYLLARAADTIADTALVAPERRAALLTDLRDEIERLGDGAALSRALEDVTRMQTDSHEHMLLASMKPMLALLRAQPDADRASIRKVVATLTSGMEFDLRTFPDEQSGQVASLPSRDELDRYTYLVAGCVGEFWTVDANSDPTALVLGNDQVTHVFICDRTNFTAALAYACNIGTWVGDEHIVNIAC